MSATIDISPARIQELSQSLGQTLSPDASIRKTAERFLESLEGTPGYGILLLNLIGTESIPPVLRTSASVYFKNFIRRHWAVPDVAVSKISEADRSGIRSLVVNLMLRSPESVQRQLSDAISVIGKHDFPSKWPSLLQELVDHMTTSGGDFRVINGVLRTAHSLFKKYRHEFKSEQLWQEIKFVLENFAKPFTELFLQTWAFAKQHANNLEALKTIFGSLVLCAKIFYSLNVQDLPEFFEDNMAIWMNNFLELMTVSNDLLRTDVDEEAGLLEQLKSQICDNVSLYASKYCDEFDVFLGSFVETIWKLLQSTGTEVKYDLLVSNAMKFLTTAAERPQNKKLFEMPGILDTLCTNIIVPNMQFRESDEEMFEDNAEEFIRRDIEGSDVDTRRRSACDLVRALSRHFEPQITSIFGQYIQSMLAQYANDPRRTWKSKDAAIFLVTSMAVKGSTSRLGATTTSELVNVLDFFTNFLRLELERPNLNELPVLRADALKYLVTFRNQLPAEQVLIPMLPVIVNHLAADSIVVHSYAANAIEKILSLRAGNSPAVQPVHVVPLAQQLLGGLFAIFAKPGSGENEYAMKAIMRTVSLLQADVLPFLKVILDSLTAKLNEVAKNPSKPNFNHYLFETITISIRIACDKDRTSLPAFENLLFPIVEHILVTYVQEFMPYAFQILSLLLEYYEPGQVTDRYTELFKMFLTPELWEKPANIQPMVRFLTAFIGRSSPAIVAANKMSPLLGVFQKLIASKSNDHQGFYILQALVMHADRTVLSQFLNNIFNVLFQRLTNSKTTKYVKHLIVFFSLFAFKYGPKTLVDVINSLQANLFAMVVEKVFLTDLQRVSGSLERKICVVGVTAILCDYPEIMASDLSLMWSPLLKALISLIELPEDASIPDDEHFIEVDDTPGYQSAYVRLVYGTRKEDDPFDGQITNVRVYLGQKLSALSHQHPGLLPPVLARDLDAKQSAHLNEYLQQSQVGIV